MGRFSFSTDRGALLGGGRAPDGGARANDASAGAFDGRGRSRPVAARRARVMALAACAVVVGGCGHFYLDNSPVVRGGAIAVPPPSKLALATGSLWRDDVGGNFLFSDVKARALGDLLTVVVLENATGSKQAETSTATKTSVAESVTGLFGFPQRLQKKQPSIDPSELVQADSDRQWDGTGSTSRKGQLSARVSAVVTAVAPNGNLWVEGEKIVSVNREDQHIVLAGWARPEDITPDNEVLSTRLAQARIDYYGVGVVGMKQRPGWGYWLLDWVWPF